MRGRRHITGIAIVVAAIAVAVLAASAGASTRHASASDTVTVVQGVDIETTDPLQTRNTTTINVLRHFYDSLIQPAVNHPNRYTPDLATAWKRMSSTVTRFTLHRGVRFSDGTPFDAQSVKYTVDYLVGRLPNIKTKPLMNYQFTSVSKAHVVNKYTVDIVTKTPDPLLFARLTQLFIIPNHSLDKNPKALASTPIGTGPYRLAEWDRNAQVVMKANPSYFLGRPKIANVIFKVMPDPAARLAALEAGTVDLIVNVPPDNIGEIKAAGATVKSVPSDRVALIWLNALKGGPLANRDVRLAMNYAVDVKTIIKTIMSGYGLRVATAVPPYFAGYSSKLRSFTYQPDRAKQLLAKAGYPHGFKITWIIPKGRYAFGEEVSQAIAQYLGKVGIDVQLKFLDFAVWGRITDERNMGGYDGFYASWGESFFNPIDLFQVAVLSGQQNFSWYKNRKVDNLINLAARTVNVAKQTKILVSIQRELIKDPAFIYLYAYKDLYGISKRLHWQPQSDESLYMYRASLS